MEQFQCCGALMLHRTAKHFVFRKMLANLWAGITVVVGSSLAAATWESQHGMEITENR
jgi:hypothetical protein